MDQRDAERAFRDGLQARAEEADVAVPVAARALAEVRRRRHRRWAVSTAAAAAVVLVVAGVQLVATRGDDAGSPPVVDDAPTTEAEPGPDEGWRTEYWQGVAVDVPASWGYGGAPFLSGRGTLACYPEAMVGPDGSRLRRPGERGWVGRPIPVTDVCAGYPWIEHSSLEEPLRPYVWLGAAVEPGVVEYAREFVQETIEVEAVTVTVGTRDPALREQILASIRPGDVCEPSLSDMPAARAGVSMMGRSGLLRAKVCAYRLTGTADFRLSYASEIQPAAAEAALAAAEAAPEAPVDCDVRPSEFVVLRAYYDDEFGRDVRESLAVYEMGCGGSIALGDGRPRELTSAAIAPVAGNGIPAVVHGPTGGKGAMIDSFIGPLG